MPVYAPIENERRHRARLARAALAANPEHVESPAGSAYLYALVCAYCAAPVPSIDHEQLEDLCNYQADLEEADFDAILDDLSHAAHVADAS